MAHKKKDHMKKEKHHKEHPHHDGKMAIKAKVGEMGHHHKGKK